MLNVHSNKRFSLVELLIVISILGMMSTLLAPSLRRISKSMDLADCKLKLKNIYHATLLYVDDNNGILPGPVEGMVRPNYRYSLDFSISGMPSRHNQKLPSFLRDYMNPKILSKSPRYDLNDTFICLGNKNSGLIEGDDYRTRPYYKTLHDGQQAFPLGRWLRKDKTTGVWEEELAPLLLSSIERPSLQGMLKDALDKNGNMKRIPDIPVHIDFNENTLFLDGSVINEQPY